MPSIELELAWAAGFFDGEGCTTYHCGKNQAKAPRVRLGQSGDTGYKVLERFKNAVGFGKVYGPYPVAKNQRKIRWAYSISKTQENIEVLKKLWPYLSDDKKAQATAILGDTYSIH